MDAFRDELFPLIEKCDHLDWLLLTKRPENMNLMAPKSWTNDGWPEHVWAMTTVEDQDAADRRIPHLEKVPASVRGISCEPLLGPVDINLQNINWCIVGCESGGGRRPFDIGWARSIKKQSDLNNTAFFMKQIPKGDGKKGVSADMKDFPEDLRVRKFPEAV